MSQRRVIGFDRELKLEWLDAVASRAAAGDSPEQVRAWLESYLGDLVRGTGRSGHRGKTITVLTRIWANVPQDCVLVRDQAVGLLGRGEVEDRLGLHWAMAMMVYPFFSEVVGIIGRLLTLQGEVERHAVVRRMTETWGDRPSVIRGARAVWTSVIWWGALREGGKRGRYTGNPRLIPVSHGVRELLLSARRPKGSQSSSGDSMGQNTHSLFPFLRHGLSD
jgi:hypothetical protein